MCDFSLILGEAEASHPMGVFVSWMCDFSLTFGEAEASHPR